MPHSINVNDVPIKPDFVFRDNSDFSIVGCTTTVLTVRNTGLVIATLNAWLWHQHTIDRAYGADVITDLVPQPFIPAVGGGGGGNAIIVEDEGGPLPGTPHTVLNFVGAGVTASDAGGGVAQISIPGSSGLGGAVLTWGNETIASAADARYLSPGHDMGTASLVNDAQIPAPRAGTLRNLFARHNSAAGNGNAVVYTVFVNGVATALTVSLATGAVGQASDLVNTIAVVQGARISLQASKAVPIGGGNIDVQVSVEVV